MWVARMERCLTASAPPPAGRAPAATTTAGEGYQTASCHSITPYASRSAPHPGSVPLKAPNGWR